MLTYTWIPKRDWPEGPWHTEADRLEEVNGSYVRLALRVQDFGHWNGYLGVPPGHPWHGVPYDELPGITVHGGVSYSNPAYPPLIDDDWDINPNACVSPTRPTLVPPEDYWFVGFDCGHFDDYLPGLVPYLQRITLAHNPAGGGDPTHYKNQEYVWDQTEHLFVQAVTAANNTPESISPIQMLKDANKKPTKEKTRTKKVWPFLS